MCSICTQEEEKEKRTKKKNSANPLGDINPNELFGEVDMRRGSPHKEIENFCPSCPTSKKSLSLHF
jgi:hypothetical protein